MSDTSGEAATESLKRVLLIVEWTISPPVLFDTATALSRGRGCRYVKGPVVRRSDRGAFP